MTTDEWFQPLAEVLNGLGVQQSPSELQGVICGLLGAGVSPEDAELEGLLAAHVQVTDAWPESAALAFAALRDQAHEGLVGDDLDLAILLPADDVDLRDRVAALGQWCEGFLTGFGTGTAGMNDNDFTPSLQEALSDLAAVSNVEIPREADDELETLFEQVAEHVRVAALMVYTEMVLRDRSKPSRDNGPATRH